jgi:cell division septum initiation protein DivIVA
MEMSLADPKNKIAEIAQEVKNTSYKEKMNLYSEKNINAFLDAILDVKSYLKERTERLNHISNLFSEVTWIDNLNEKDLELIHDIISSAKELRYTLVKIYINYNELKIRGIATDEVKEFKKAIDNYTEDYEDLEYIFFNSSKNKLFNQITTGLSKL